MACGWMPATSVAGAARSGADVRDRDNWIYGTFGLVEAQEAAVFHMEKHATER